MYSVLKPREPVTLFHISPPIPNPATAAGAVEAHVVPLEVRTLPDVLGATA